MHIHDSGSGGSTYAQGVSTSDATQPEARTRTAANGREDASGEKQRSFRERNQVAQRKYRLKSKVEIPSLFFGHLASRKLAARSETVAAESHGLKIIKKQQIAAEKPNESVPRSLIITSLTSEIRPLGYRFQHFMRQELLKRQPHYESAPLYYAPLPIKQSKWSHVIS